MGLAIVVAMALAGGDRDGDVVAVASHTVSPAPSGDLADAGAIVLDWPAMPNQVITTGELVVRGHLRTGAARVQVLLQSSGAVPIVVRSVRPVTQDWDRDDDPEGPTFVVTVPLPDPRPSGPAVVQIVTYDVSGRAQGVLLRTIQIGAMFNPTTRGLPGRPSLGEDGLIGGIPFDTNWSPDGG